MLRLARTNDLPADPCSIGGVPNVSMMVSNVGGMPLSADQEFEAGFTCNGVHATPTIAAARSTARHRSSARRSSRCRRRTRKTTTTTRRASEQRNLFDLAVGDDNLFHGDRYKWSARVTVINLANKYALYNFLSTFSGTHYVTPRTVTGEIGFHF